MVYATVILNSAWIDDPLDQASAERVLHGYLPWLFLIAGSYFVYMYRNPANVSVTRVIGTAVFDSAAATMCVTGGPLFQPFLALFPWFSLVYGVRFGPTWLLFSSTLSVSFLLYLLLSAQDHHLDQLLVGSSILTLMIVAAYCHRLIQRLQDSQQELARLATFDYLTGLPNRRLLQDRLSKALAFGPRIQRDLAVLYFDLDGFKRVNDQLGHSVGDKLLCEVANRVQTHLRAIDTFSRIAGDEFVVVLEGQRGEHGAERVAKLILESVRAITSIDGNPIHISASVGITLWPTSLRPVVTTPDELIQMADRAMYVAKRQGKDQSHCLVPDDKGGVDVVMPAARPT